jgi:hypothetical protein
MTCLLAHHDKKSSSSHQVTGLTNEWRAHDPYFLSHLLLSTCHILIDFIKLLQQKNHVWKDTQLPCGINFPSNQLLNSDYNVLKNNCLHCQIGLRNGKALSSLDNNNHGAVKLKLRTSYEAKKYPSLTNTSKNQEPPSVLCSIAAQPSCLIHQILITGRFDNIQCIQKNQGNCQ